MRNGGCLFLGGAALRWADAVIWSRGVAVPRQGGEGAPDTPGGVRRKWEQLSLLPGLDMCNHVGGDGANASWVPAAEGAVELRRIVKKQSEPDEQQQQEQQQEEEVELTISYGDKPGEEFLFLYGFMPQDNPVRKTNAWLFCAAICTVKTTMRFELHTDRLGTNMGTIEGKGVLRRMRWSSCHCRRSIS